MAARVRRLDMARPFGAGWRARAKGRGVEAMPYDVNSTDPVEKLRVFSWLRGWRTHPG